MTQENTVTVAERVALALKRHGVEIIFAQSLPSAVLLAAEAIGIRQIAYRQENMGGAMADGFARCSGRVGVVAAQNGPAATLLVPPLAEALKASVPVVALVQDVERDQADRNAFQELDHFDLFRACAKWVKRPIIADRIDDYVDMAFTAASSGRPGPAVLLLPADLLREVAQPSLFLRTAHLGASPLDLCRPADHLLSQVAQKLADARAPVVIAGGGVHNGQGILGITALQELAALPVFTTNMGKGSVDEHHPLSAGVITMTGPRSLGRRSRVLLDNADLVLLVGTRTNQNGTDSWRLLPATATIVHIDVDPQEIGRNYQAIRLVGDAGETLAALCCALESQDLSRRHADRKRLEALIADAWRHFDEDRELVVDAAVLPLRPEAVMAQLQNRLTADTTVVADASYASMWIAGQLRALKAGMRFISPRGLAGLGWGLPLALGAKAAAPDRPVVVVVGDGGFAHSWAELETLIRANLPVTIILLNNGILGFQKHAETVKFGRFTTACDFNPVDHCKIAEACGCPAIRVLDQQGLVEALDRSLNTQKPLLIEVMTDPNAFPPLSLFANLEEVA